MGRPKIVVLGTMCHQPLAGMVWLFLHYLLGFERLGYETYYVEWHGRWVPDPVDAEKDKDVPRVLVGAVLDRFGFGERWICRADHLGFGRSFGGMTREALPRLYDSAEAIINVTGSHFLADEQLNCPRRVYLETDPGVPQVRLSEGDRAMRSLVSAHTHHFTWAQNIHGDTTLLPEVGLEYHVTRQPVVGELWDASDVTAQPRFTTVARWEKQGKDVVLDQVAYHWSKHLQFLEILELPSKTAQCLELALSRVPAEDRMMLERHGWKIRDGWWISRSIDTYRHYVQSSLGEVTIAKDQYVRLRTGWFSDRSACYLGAGRPVITQDTGFGVSLPTGEGILAFSDLREATEAIKAVSSDYARHARAARAISKEYFDSGVVLGDLLKTIGLEAPALSRAGTSNGHDA